MKTPRQEQTWSERLMTLVPYVWLLAFFLAPFLVIFTTFVAWPLVRSLILSFTKSLTFSTT